MAADVKRPAAEDNLGLVHLCANKLRGRGIEYDDLYSAGCVGLLKAVRAFDPERGVQFSTYANTSRINKPWQYTDKDYQGQEYILTATPDKRLTRVFKVIDKSPLQLGTGAVLCMADKFSAFDSNNLIVPIWMI